MDPLSMKYGTSGGLGWRAVSDSWFLKTRRISTGHSFKRSEDEPKVEPDIESARGDLQPHTRTMFVALLPPKIFFLGQTEF